MKDLLVHIIFISIILFYTGYNLYCFKKGDYDSIRVWRTTKKETIIWVIMMILLIFSIYILQPSNINYNVLKVILAIHVVVLNVLNILIFNKTNKNKKNNIIELISYDILIAFMLCFILR
ncbi:hypothetical protein [Oceanirhabdus seepicola]|uniref:Uncharacterized protein n=1 Tax=Oceanirhabdus seepicola TaxID=2828781 RepID=A0A9J6P6C6_9CLOT|nr:hypothetical protein [Oceanirhabdus seepicola]MCM1992287.1 hypothetical protein [Oceanirhabdus seepicola]